MCIYQITIENEKENKLHIFDNIVKEFNLFPEYTKTKDGFEYSFKFHNLEQQEKFKQAVERRIPDLYY